ncbi:MAG: hypothetical protein U0V70_05135 [Terriglobia bacterium]
MSDETKGPPSGKMDESTRKKLEQVYTDQAAFRAMMVDGLKDLIRLGLDREDRSGHGFKQMFSPGGYWHGVLKEKETILLEALGPNYKNHPKFTEIEVMVLFNLGRLEMIRHKDDIQALMNGELR